MLSIMSILDPRSSISHGSDVVASHRFNLPDARRNATPQNGNSDWGISSATSATAAIPSPAHSPITSTGHCDSPDSNNMPPTQNGLSLTGNGFPKNIYHVVPPADSITLLRSTKERLDPLRNDFQCATLDYKISREKLFRYALHLQGLKPKLMLVIKRLTSPVEPELIQETKDDLDVVWADIDSSINGLQEEGRKCSHIENQMSNIMYWVAQMENDMCPSLDEHIQHVEPSDNFSSWAGLSQPQDQNMEQMDNGTPPIVQDLYSWMGDYKNYMEDLHNFEFELRADLDERDVARVNGTAMISDEDFFKERRERRAQLQRDLERAQVEVSRLREQCIRDGIPFQDDAYPSVSDNEANVQGSTHSCPTDTHIVNPLDVSPKSIIGDYYDTQNRIVDWIEDTPQEDSEPEPFQEFEEPSEQTDLDAISERSWIAPSRPHPSAPSTTTISEIRSALPSMHTALTKVHTVSPPAPVFEGPRPGSPQIEALLLASMSESIFPKQAWRLPGHDTASESTIGF